MPKETRPEHRDKRHERQQDIQKDLMTSHEQAVSCDKQVIGVCVHCKADKSADEESFMVAARHH